MLNIALLLAMAALSAAPQGSPAPHPCGTTIEHARWAKTPSSDDVDKAYPKRAATRNVAGAARIRCIADSKGGMTNCEVLEETPQGYDFGSAALKLSKKFRMDVAAATRPGCPVDGATVIIPITFSP